MRAIRLELKQPLPILLQAPSPSAGNQATELKLGHRLANGSRRFCRGVSRSPNGDSWSIRTDSTPSTSRSQSQRSWSKNPVADAMEMQQMVFPNNFSSRYSPKEIQRVARRHTSGRL